MADRAFLSRSALKESMMRYMPAALALSLVAAVTASAGYGAARQPDPRAVVLAQSGKADLDGGKLQAAVDQFEAALAIDPGYTALYVDLADAARLQGLQGKAIRYYRSALEREPENFAAISGEGEALLEKGAVEKARRNLSQLESLCGSSCAETRQLAAAIERGRTPTVMTADAAKPEPVVTQN